MSKRLRSLLAFCLCLILAAGLVLPALAAEADPRTLEIRTVAQLLEFAENCQQDSYSRGLTVSLEENLDLSNTEFHGIPIFCGTFLGRDHEISGLNITSDGSNQGLFRYLTETAEVQHLNVKGTVRPGGSRSKVGGIAGSNAGTIKLCRFSGEVSGGSVIGAIAGENRVTGVIEKCYSDGSVYGGHFVGGIVGKNFGTVRFCGNGAQVNTTASQNDIDLSDITLETLSGTEAANTVTDVGGIAGYSSGVLRSCTNSATVGYPHMGYNVGGIAGSQQGYLFGCTNYSPVRGRKEVGGIVGQMEPNSKVEFAEDTLQILHQQLVGVADLAGQASANAHNSTSSLHGQINHMQDLSQTAKDAVTALVPDPETGYYPGPDELLAAQNTLSSSLSGMQGTVTGMAATAKDTMSTLSGDIRALNQQINTIGQTLQNATEHLGGTVTDISDLDQPDDLTGKVGKCKNLGRVLGDLNVGGIVGAISWENDLDPEDDLQLTGNESLNFESEIRAVVLDCENKVPVTGHKRNIGGIVGWMAMGLVKNCINTGTVDAGPGKYAGGIAGTSTGYLRGNSAKCRLYGTACVGGIAGSGAVVTDSRSMVHVEGGRERLGAILGTVSQEQKLEETSILQNYYLVADQQLGGIDGISYEGRAEALEPGAFFMLENLPRTFTRATVSFAFDSKDHETVEVFPGESIDPKDIPAVPEKEGFNGAWENLDELDPEHVYFDHVFKPVYTPYQVTVRSRTERDWRQPLLLAQGSFRDMDNFEVKAMEALPDPGGKLTAVEAWELPDFGQEDQIQLRFALPEKKVGIGYRILLRHRDGTWTQVPYSLSGSYAVVTAQAGDDGIGLAEEKEVPWKLYVLVAVLAAGAGIVFGLRHRRRRKAGKKK